MDFDAFEAAIRSPTPYQGLRDVVRGRLVAGSDREELRLELEAFRAGLQSQGREQEDDIVLDVLDDLTGWSGPQLEL